jgi:uncharacterized OB-fold protein
MSEPAKTSIKCGNCGEPLEPNMDKCPKCGSKNRAIAIEDRGRGQEMVTVTRSLAMGYSQLSETFDAGQKTIAASVDIPSKLETLEKIAEIEKEQTELMKQQIKDAKEDAKKQKRYFYVSIAIAVVAIIVAIFR